MRVSAMGGNASPVTSIEQQQLGHLFPHVLPDGINFLYAVTGTLEVRGIYAGRLGDPGSKQLLPAASGAVLSFSGHILFAREGALYAQVFDRDRVTVVGEPIRLADRVATDRGAAAGPDGAAVSASAAGPIVFRAASATNDRQLVWYDRSGTELSRVGAPSAAGTAPSLSPDGRQMALSRLVDGNRDIWLLDIQRGVFSRFTFDRSPDGSPNWTPDGTRVVFSSLRSGVLGLYQKSVAGGPEEPLLVTDQNINTSDISSDGQVLLFSRADPKTLRDLWALPLGRGKTPYPLMQTPAQDLNGQLAPNGLWMAYQSNESGRHEIGLRMFTGGGRVIQVSADGGSQPRWRRDGRELFYLDLDGRLMAVPITFSSDAKVVTVGAASPLFATRIGGANTLQSEYVVSPDGQRFLLDTPVRDDSPPIQVILNWRPVPSTSTNSF